MGFIRRLLKPQEQKDDEAPSKRQVEALVEHMTRDADEIAELLKTRREQTLFQGVLTGKKHATK
jgi:hypothetical protein